MILYEEITFQIAPDSLSESMKFKFFSGGGCPRTPLHVAHSMCDYAAHSAPPLLKLWIRPCSPLTVPSLPDSSPLIHPHSPTSTEL